MDEFFEELCPYYNFIVFTAAQKMYADFVISRIDPEARYVKQRFYRDHCKTMGKHQAKDLNIVVALQNYVDGEGKPIETLDVKIDLSKLIIIDNLVESFQLQPSNGIKIKDWFGEDMTDRCLKNLIPALKAIAESDCNDVRLELTKLRK